MTTPCNQEARLAIIETTLALKFTQIMDIFKRMETKLDTFINKSELTYATKEEVNNIKSDVNTIKNNTASTKLERIKTWGALIVALISAGSIVLSAYINK